MKHFVLGVITLSSLVGAAALIIHSQSKRTPATIREEGRDEGQKLPHNTVREGADGAGGKVQDGPREISEAIGDFLGRDGNDVTVSRTEPKQIRPDEVVSDVFDLFHKASKLGDDVGQQVLGLDLEEENAWGVKFDDVMREQSKVFDDPATLQQIERLAAPLVQLCRRPGIKFDFVVLDDPRINACSILGGHIYVNKGLLDFVTSDAELQSVLGHEIGHVELGHCVRRTTYAVRASEIATVASGSLVSMLHALISVGYSEDDEFEADEWGARRMMSIDRSQEEILSFTRRFNDFLAHQGIETVEGADTDTVAGVVLQQIGDHFRTHPPGQERLRRLELVTTARNR